MDIVPQDDEEAKLAEWDPSHVRPIDLKRQSRRQWHWLLWMQLKSYKEICKITGWGRNTVWEDIKAVNEELAKTPTRDQDVRTLALMSLRITKVRIMESVEKYEAANASATSIAALYKEIAAIDKTILSRYTVPKGDNTAVVEAEERAMMVIDYFTEKYGPDALEGFKDYYNMRKAKKRVLNE
jgi:hypothetical protein